MNDLSEFFERHVPERADDMAFTSVRELNDVVSIEITDATNTHAHHLWFEGGRLRQCGGIPVADVRTTFSLSRDTFLSIAAGELAPQLAFFTFRLGIHGDVLFGLQLGTLLAGFFRRHPWKPSR